MATVYKRDSTYWIRFRSRGKDIWRSAYTPSNAAVQQFLAQRLEEHGRLDGGGRPRRTFKETQERFTYDYLPTLKPTSQQKYRTRFRQPDAAFGTLFLDEISRWRLTDHVQKSGFDRAVAVRPGQNRLANTSPLIH